MYDNLGKYAKYFLDFNIILTQKRHPLGTALLYKEYKRECF